MYLILNFGMSAAFQALQFNRLEFPGYMYVDYVRVWQEKGKGDISCNPKSHPTADYINTYIDYYTNREYEMHSPAFWLILSGSQLDGLERNKGQE